MDSFLIEIPKTLAHGAWAGQEYVRVEVWGMPEVVQAGMLTRRISLLAERPLVGKRRASART